MKIGEGKRKTMGGKDGYFDGRGDGGEAGGVEKSSGVDGQEIEGLGGSRVGR